MASKFEAQLTQSRTLVEQYLADLFAAFDGSGELPERLLAASRHAVLGGGKRFRPFLVLESAKLFSASPVAALNVAAALECVHCYSLVHDDLPAMDNDLLRRGVPTVWSRFDEWTAILAGDSLLTLAFEILSRPDASQKPERHLQLVSELARAAGGAGMVGGQIFDLMADKLGQPEYPDLQYVRRLQSMKTGALIRFACKSGPLLAGADSADIHRLERFGDALGLAFQISDDLLDATGNAERVGKAVAKDLDQGKVTLVSLYGVEGAQAMLASTQKNAHDALREYGDRARVLLAAVDYMATRDS